MPMQPMIAMQTSIGRARNMVHSYSLGSVNVELPPLETLVGLALSDTVGGAETVTVAD